MSSHSLTPITQLTGNSNDSPTSQTNRRALPLNLHLSAHLDTSDILASPEYTRIVNAVVGHIRTTLEARIRRRMDEMQRQILRDISEALSYEAINLLVEERLTDMYADVRVSLPLRSNP